MIVRGVGAIMSIVDLLAANPWIWVLLAVDLAIWLFALRLVFKNSKFLRKGRWVLLTLVTFSVSWSMRENRSVTAGLPLGSLYVIWFARFGRPPTPEAIAAHAQRASVQKVNLPPEAPVWRIRLAYGLAIVASSALTLWMTLAPTRLAWGTMFGSDDGLIRLMALMGFAPFMAVLLFLLVRPQSWGKILCLFCAFAWTTNGLFRLPMMADGKDVGLVWPPVVCGLAMLAAAIALHVFDPRPSPLNLRRLISMPRVTYDDPALDESESSR
jgi:hypothetical protein